MYVEHVFAIGILKPDLSDTRHNDNTIKRSRRPRTPNPPSATSTTAPKPGRDKCRCPGYADVGSAGGAGVEVRGGLFGITVAGAWMLASPSLRAYTLTSALTPEPEEVPRR